MIYNLFVHIPFPKPNPELGWPPGPCRGVWTRPCKFGMRSAPLDPVSEGFLVFVGSDCGDTVGETNMFCFQKLLKLLSSFEHLRFLSQLLLDSPRNIFRIKESRSALHAMHAWVIELCPCNTLYRKEVLSVFCKRSIRVNAFVFCLNTTDIYCMDNLSCRHFLSFIWQAQLQSLAQTLKDTKP